MVQIAQMCNAALKPKQCKQKTYCNKNGGNLLFHVHLRLMCVLGYFLVTAAFTVLL